MASRRQSKVSEAIRETVSSAILRFLRDPRIKNVTVLNAEVSPDLRSAKVYVSVMGADKVKALAIQGLESARGFLQSKIADRLQTKHTPILKFVLDHPDSPARQAQRILEELAAERERLEREKKRQANERPDDDSGQLDDDEVDSEDLEVGDSPNELPPENSNELSV